MMSQKNELRGGRITQTVWQRSVRKQLHTKRAETIWEPSPWEVCSGLELSGGRRAAWADVQLSGSTARTGYYAVYHAAGNLAARGISAIGVSIRFLLPHGSSEECLAELVSGIEQACSELKMQVTSLDGDVTGAVSRIVVSASASGEIADAAEQPGNCGPDPAGTCEILMCGYTGLEGMLRILDEAEEELASHFVSTFLAQASALSKELVRPEQILSVTGCGAATARQIGRGGVLAALWELAESEHLGFEIGMPQIPLKQETVELCEYYRLNPYLMTSAGSYLILAKDARKVSELLRGAGVRAARLGTARAQNARVIRNGEETRYLDRPARDELDRWQEERRTPGNRSSHDEKER